MSNHYISTPSRTKELLRKHGITLKQSLGQNFLTDANILRNIVAAAKLDRTKGAIEVGPGIGALTQHLAEAAGRVVAVEIDNRLLPALEETLAPYPNASVVQADILKVDLDELVREHFEGIAPISVVANLPYYITTPIIMKLLESRLPLEYIVVMVQKEVAQRMQAAPGGKEYGSLSIAVQVYCEPEIVMIVPGSVFVPQPDVDSAVIRLRVLPEPRIPESSERWFFRVVHAAFAQRRKTLINNLQAAFGKENKAALLSALEAAGIDGSRRGETLSIAEFADLADALRTTLSHFAID
jgi:16S rRNA (adenine1518-N6/adenine1519-N6)-dimethyltransferase